MGIQMDPVGFNHRLVELEGDCKLLINDIEQNRDAWASKIEELNEKISDLSYEHFQLVNSMESSQDIEKKRDRLRKINELIDNAMNLTDQISFGIFTTSKEIVDSIDAHPETLPSEQEVPSVETHLPEYDETLTVTVNNDNLQEVLCLAHETGSEPLFQKCFDFIKSETNITLRFQNPAGPISIFIQSKNDDSEINRLRTYLGRLVDTVGRENIRVSIFQGPDFSLENLKLFVNETCGSICTLNLSCAVTPHLVSDDDLSDLLKNCSNLNDLSIKSDKITEKGIQELHRLKSLQTLYLDECSNLTELTLPQGMRSLRTLEVFGCPNLKQFTLAQDMNSLQNLIIRDSPVVLTFSCALLIFLIRNPDQVKTIEGNHGLRPFSSILNIAKIPENSKEPLEDKIEEFQSFISRSEKLSTLGSYLDDIKIKGPFEQLPLLRFIAYIAGLILTMPEEHIDFLLRPIFDETAPATSSGAPTKDNLPYLVYDHKSAPHRNVLITEAIKIAFEKCLSDIFLDFFKQGSFYPSTMDHFFEKFPNTVSEHKKHNPLLHCIDDFRNPSIPAAKMGETTRNYLFKSFSDKPTMVGYIDIILDSDRLTEHSKKELCLWLVITSFFLSRLPQEVIEEVIRHRLPEELIELPSPQLRFFLTGDLFMLKNDTKMRNSYSRGDLPINLLIIECDHLKKQIPEMLIDFLPPNDLFFQLHLMLTNLPINYIDDRKQKYKLLDTLNMLKQTIQIPPRTKLMIISELIEKPLVEISELEWHKVFNARLNTLMVVLLSNKERELIVPGWSAGSLQPSMAGTSGSSVIETNVYDLDAEVGSVDELLELFESVDGFDDPLGDKSFLSNYGFKKKQLTDAYNTSQDYYNTQLHKGVEMTSKNIINGKWNLSQIFSFLGKWRKIIQDYSRRPEEIRCPEELLHGFYHRSEFNTFGIPRPKWKEMITPASGTSLYTDLGVALKKDLFKVSDDNTYEFSNYEVKAVIGDEEITLETYGFVDSRNKFLPNEIKISTANADQLRFVIYHTSPKFIPIILKHTGDLYKSSLNTDTSPEQTLRLCGEMFCWICRAKPWDRGDPSIAEIFIRSVWAAKYDGEMLPAWNEGVVPWEKVILEQDPKEFGKSFASLFAYNPLTSTT